MKVSYLCFAWVALLLLVGCGGGGGGGGGASKMRITPSGAAYMLDSDRIVIGVPANAVTTEQIVTYGPPTTLPPDARFIPATGIEFSPATFLVPASLHIKYSIANLPPHTTEDQLVIARLTPSGWVEEPKSHVDTTLHAVDVFITTLGTFGVYVKPVP